MVSLSSAVAIKFAVALFLRSWVRVYYSVSDTLYQAYVESNRIALFSTVAKLFV